MNKIPPAFDSHRGGTCCIKTKVQQHGKIKHTLENINLSFSFLISKGLNMETTVRWTGVGGMSFIAETGSGHAVMMDGAPEGGGHNRAPRPMEMVLLGTGGCTAYDVVLILRKGKQDVRGCDVKLSAKRADTEPKVFTKIHFHFTVTGRNLKPAQVERAISLSHEKYCSASIMLAKTAEITHSFEIVDDLTLASEFEKAD